MARLQGHQDFSFAAAWHPGGVLLATGNQDTTTLLWDVRKTDEPLTRLAGRLVTETRTAGEGSAG